MEQHKDRAPSDPVTAAEFAGESSWSLGTADDGDGAGTYFFSGHRERSIISEFGWNLEPDQPNRIGADDGGGEGLWLPPLTGSIEPVDAAAGSAAASSSRSNNQSVSSSSSEDPPEKSTVSDEKPPSEIPWVGENWKKKKKNELVFHTLLSTLLLVCFSVWWIRNYLKTLRRKVEISLKKTKNWNAHTPTKSTQSNRLVACLFVL